MRPVKHSLTASEVQRVEDHHRKLLDLCLDLEELAGELEAGCIPANTLTLSQTVEPLLSTAHAVEEIYFYPDLDMHAGSCFGSLMIEQMKAEHRFDRRAAQELSLTLSALCAHHCKLGFETVAHMVRGFQEYLRRHITVEQVLLQTLLEAQSEESRVV